MRRNEKKEVVMISFPVNLIQFDLICLVCWVCFVFVLCQRQIRADFYNHDEREKERKREREGENKRITYKSGSVKSNTIQLETE